MTHPPHDQLDWGGMSLQDILELALADEIEARNYYRTAANLAGTLHTRRMLLGLAEMEQGHADALRKEIDDLRLQRDLEAGMAD
jgi:rubrerythrin